MKSSRWLAAALLVAFGLLAGCESDSKDNPFIGSWISETRGRITFASDTWSDSDGDGGTYSFTGEYPIYEVTFVYGKRTTVERATFIDSMTLELCPVLSTGGLGTCDELVIDRPTLH